MDPCEVAPAQPKACGVELFLYTLPLSLSLALFLAPPGRDTSTPAFDPYFFATDAAFCRLLAPPSILNALQHPKWLIYSSEPFQTILAARSGGRAVKSPLARSK